jgi:hypothetical protein
VEFGLEGTGFDGLFGIDVEVSKRFDVVVYIFWVSVCLLLLGGRLKLVWWFLQGM